jgi:leader peptidase (prepilin peptidase)/N-methyltransferase
MLLLPWPLALASIALGALMIAGADVDARTFLLPDFVTVGAAVCGIVAAAVLDPFDPWGAGAGAGWRALGTAGVMGATAAAKAWASATSSSLQRSAPGCRSMPFRSASAWRLARH